MSVASQRSVWAAALFAIASCANDPYPDQPPPRPVADEVFHYLCKRVARDSEQVRQSDLTGVQFDALCDAPADLDHEPRVAQQPRLKALLLRRQAIVDAIAQSVGDRPVRAGATFAEGELRAFLGSLMPLYDDGRLPAVSRKLAELMRLVIDPADARAVQVIRQLSAISPRVGYRTEPHALGAARPFFSYDGLDEFSKRLLGLLGEGGDGHDELVSLLKVAALELADEPSDRSTLHVALDLLLREDPTLAEGNDKLWTLRRDTRGYAQTTQGSPFVDQDGLASLDAQGRFVVDGKGATSAPWPFKKEGVDPVTVRDSEGRALNPAGQPMFSYFDANATVLAASMRELKSLLERKVPGQPSTLENAAHGIRPMLGPNTSLTYTFSKPYDFEGRDLSKSPMLELLHAITQILKQPETRDTLQLMKVMIEQYESSASGPIFAALGIDARGDGHPEAQLVGYDGTHATPSAWWDDAIATAVRMLKRPKLLEALVDAYADPLSGQQGQLYATWMSHNDVITYANAPFAGDTTADRFSAQQVDDLNSSVADHGYSRPVDRTKPDTSMNRSIWQRTMSLMHTLNGQPMCNKEGGFLGITEPLSGRLPLIGEYKRCEFIEVQDPSQAYAQAVLGTIKVSIKDQGLKDFADFGSSLGVLPSTGEVQELNTQIKGFNDKPTPASVARFISGPRNKFSFDLFGEQMTNEGVPLSAYEPYAMFPMEVVDRTALVDGAPQSFIANTKPLMRAFDSNELRDADGKLIDGYMFGDVLNTFHMHWSSPRPDLCTEPLQAGVSEGCTQSRDVTKKFWSYQSNLVSYEPLLIEAFRDEKLTAILQQASAALQTITVNGKTGKKVLADFVAMMLRPNTALAYRDGRRYSLTNFCGPNSTAERCECPPGATDEGDNCKIGDRIFPRGKVLGVSPLYLVLDALQNIDKAFASDEARHAAWLSARSELVDQLFAAESAAQTFRFKNQRSRKLAVAMLEWIDARIEAHQGDFDSWADGLVARAEKVLSHPLLPRTLDLLDVIWSHADAGDQLAALGAYLMDANKYPDAFAGMVVASADTLTFLDREPNLTPLVQFAALALAPDAFASLDAGREPNVEDGLLLKGLELTRAIAELQQGSSVLSRVLKNSVLTDAHEAPLQVLIDSVAEINRADPSMDADYPMAPADASGALDSTQQFLSDGERGLERIYTVIQSRHIEN